MPNFYYLQSLILPVWSGTLAQKQDELAEIDVSLPISDGLFLSLSVGPLQLAPILLCVTGLHPQVRQSELNTAKQRLLLPKPLCRIYK